MNSILKKVSAGTERLHERASAPELKNPMTHRALKHQTPLVPATQPPEMDPETPHSPPLFFRIGQPIFDAVQREPGDMRPTLSGIALIEDLRRQIRLVLYESILYPANGRWMSQQLALVFSHANRCAGVAPEDAVKVEYRADNIVIVRQAGFDVRLFWETFWQTSGRTNRSVERLADLLSYWPVYLPS